MKICMIINLIIFFNRNKIKHQRNHEFLPIQTSGGDKLIVGSGSGNNTGSETGLGSITG